MKIIYIAIKGIDKIGCIETYTAEVEQRLAKMGHEIIVYTLKTEEHSRPYQYKGMTIIPLPALRNSSLAQLFLVILASLHQFKHRNVDLLHYRAIGPMGDLWSEWYSNAGVFELPSEIEGLPIPLPHDITHGSQIVRLQEQQED